MSADFIDDIHQAVLEYETSRPRSLQKTIGPSEMGTECDRMLAYQLSGTQPQPRQNDQLVTVGEWAAFLGSAAHARLADALRAFNARHNVDRYKYIEAGINSDELGVTGTVDCLDGTIATDWKFSQYGTLTKVRKEGAYLKHRIQGQMYAAILTEIGETVDTVRVAYLPLGMDLSKAVICEEPYDPQVAEDATTRRNWIQSDITYGRPPTMFAATPGGRECDFCKFRRPGVVDARGCPGVGES